ncbi:adenosine 5'-monophosphoramidase HINT3-like isoform X2 [Dreissena polymorpha]|uniref:adenosine 5'-monophosphoramidase HINT3-like isoform X2 n=1 Tax=Dreissena polymorpha TaxID=45954 RepID=UPI002263DB6E|nr:adenosine 5'-monophosphoramidase HINT3-like isoform X2 [Dreissena polymorpha]
MMDIIDSCIFCKITRKEDQKTELLYDDERVSVFRDIRPATPHHYLVASKEHIPDAKHLNPEHSGLVEHMVSVGKGVMATQSGGTSDIRLGFHWPPFHTISHLHLHVISSTNQMGWIAKGIFMPNSYWFVTRLKKAKD